MRFKEGRMKKRSALWAAILLGLFAVTTAMGSTNRVIIIEDFDDTS
jgi:hypothetical protein